MDIKKTQQLLLSTYVALANSQKADISVDTLQRFLGLALESIRIEHLADKTLALHSIEQLQQHSVEQALMHVFLLSSYLLAKDASEHPLEQGIIKQKINGILPLFEQAATKGLISTDSYNKNADALLHISENTSEKGAILQALANEYSRLTPC